MIEEKNATIESTMLGVEDHGCFTFYLYLDYGGAGQGFGGHVLDEPLRDPDVPDIKDWERRDGGRFVRRRGTAYGADAIMQVLTTLKVGTWEKLPGTPCRVRSGHDRVHAIGHYLEDRWLDLSVLADEWGVGKASQKDRKATGGQT